ncbi:MAG: ATP-grasp domain-containing protein [Phycisphaerae bacterium]|nr:ATP-grasp domain-containing protein [Phycisphaerae bacterium]
MTQSLNITVLVDASTIPADDPQFHDPTEKAITEYHVIEALRHLHHDVSVIGIFDNLEEMIAELKEHKRDLVFNLTEQYCGERLWDKNIAGVLDMLQIPYTGSGPMGMMLCRDKRLCKELLGLHKIRVPNFLSLPWGKTIHVNKSIQFPLVVKPALGDGSEGISNASLVNHVEALRERAEFIHDRWHQDAIAEEYIEGRELYVTVLGNKRLNVCPARECVFDFDKDEGPNLATYRVKWNDDYREKWGINFGFADLEAETIKRTGQICKRAFRVLHLRDYARIDLRLKPDGRIVILEANPNPDLAWGEEVAEAAQRAGIDYNTLIDFIIRQTLKRKGEVT